MSKKVCTCLKSWPIFIGFMGAFIVSCFSLQVSYARDEGYKVRSGILLNAKNPAPVAKETRNYQYSKAAFSPSNTQVHLAASKSDIESGPQSSKKAMSIWFTLFVIFLGGLALNLTPCVYPLIPITISYFGGKGEKIRGHTILHGSVYILGLAATNSLLGLSSALSGGMLGYALQKPAVLIFVACVMVAMGLSFFGFWQIRLPSGLTRFASRQYGGLFGTLFMGLTLGIIAAPCLGPFILGLLVHVGQKGDAFLGFLYFFVLSLGMGLPLLVLAVFSGLMIRLPRSGDWMLWVRKLMGWVLFGMAAFMLGYLIRNDFAKAALLAGLALAAGVHLGWLDKTGRSLSFFSYAKKIVGIALVCGGLVCLTLTLRQPEEIQWVSYNKSSIVQAAEENKPIMIDFYAEWCAPCRAMDTQIFSTPEVISLSQEFVAVRVDLTSRNPKYMNLIKKYNIRGIPTIVFLGPDGEEQRDLRIESFVDESIFTHRLESVLKETASGG